MDKKEKKKKKNLLESEYYLDYFRVNLSCWAYGLKGCLLALMLSTLGADWIEYLLK